MLDFFKVLFSQRKKKPPELPPEDDGYIVPMLHEGAVKNAGVNPPPIKPKPKIVPPPQKRVIIDPTPLEESIMAEIYLVVLDGTGRTNFKALTQQLQNFYFVHASDPEKAKEMVIYSFLRSKRRPSDQLINEIQAALKVTPINAIFRNMGPQNNFWTYIPFGGRAAAGQQAVPPDPARLVAHTDPNMPDATSAREFRPAPPAGGVEVTADDLRSVQFSGADGRVLNKLRPQSVAPLPEDAPPLNPENEIVMKALNEQNNNMQTMQTQMKQMMDIIAAQQAQLAAAAAPAAKRGKKAAVPAAPEFPSPVTMSEGSDTPQ